MPEQSSQEHRRSFHFQHLFFFPRLGLPKLSDMVMWTSQKKMTSKKMRTKTPKKLRRPKHIVFDSKLTITEGFFTLEYQPKPKN